MIERVAKAIKIKYINVPMRKYMTDDESLVLAKAAIAAMREPTDKMLVAAETAVPKLESFADKKDSPSYIAYQVMIDEALKPDK